MTLMILNGAIILGFLGQGGESLTLDQAVQQALHRYEFTQAQSLTRDKAMASVELAKDNLGPKFFAAGHVVAGSNSSLGLSDVAFSRDRVGLEMVYPVYDGGKRMASLNLARSAAKAASAGLDQTRIDLIDEATSLFFEVIKAQSHLDVSNAVIKATDAHLADVQERFKLGDATKGEILAAQSSAAKAETGLAADMNALTDAQTRLALITGAGTAAPFPREQAPPPIAYRPEDAQSLVDKAIAASPYLMQLNAELELANYQLQSDKADYEPKLDAIAGVGYANFNDPFAESHSFNRGYLFAGLQGSWGMFTERSKKQSVREQTDAIQLKELDIRKAKESLDMQVRLALLTFGTAQSELTSAQSAYDASKEALRLSSERYNVGRGTQIEVLVALGNMATAGDLAADAQVQVDLAALKIRRLTEKSPAL